jgi:predicted dehydrogenase
MRKIKIAFLGAGHDHSGANITRFKEQTDLYEIVGYHIPEDDELQEKPEAIEKLFDGIKRLDLSELLENPEIEGVVVEAVDKKLVKYATLAAKANKHIFMDKPGSGSFEEFSVLVDEIKKRNLVFETGYMYRYNPYVLKLKEEIKRGELGEILGIEAQMNCSHSLKKRDWLADYPGGMMHFLGCHLVDLIFSIQGKPEKVTPYNRCSGYEGTKGTDVGFAVFEYKNGISFAKTSAVELGGLDRRNFTVIGSKKTVELCPFEQFDKEGMYTDITEYVNPDWTNPGKKGRKYFDRYAAMTAAFASYINGETENLCAPDYERDLYKLILEACGK